MKPLSPVSPDWALKGLETEEQFLQQLEEYVLLHPEVEPLRNNYLRSRRLQSTLFKITELASSELPLSTLYEELHALVAQLLNADNFYIALYDDGDDEQAIHIVYDVDHYDTSNALEIPSERILSGMTGYLLRQQRPVLVAEPDIRALIECGEITPLGTISRNWLGVPLFDGNECIGAVVVQSYLEQISYSEQDKQLLEFVGRHIAIALVRARFVKQLEQRVTARTEELLQANRQLEYEIQQRKDSEKLKQALFNIAELAQNTHNLDDFYHQVHGIIGELMFADNFYIALLDNSRKVLSFPYRVDQFDAIPRPRTAARGLTEYLLHQSHGEALLLQRDRLDQLIADDELTPSGTPSVSWLGAPLVDRDGDVFGAIVIQSYDPRIQYTTREQELITFVARHLSNALMHKRHHDQLEKRVHERTWALSISKRKLEYEIVERRRIEEQLKHDAVHDSLTGLANRKLLLENLEELFKQHRNHANPSLFAIIFIDLDRFKVINDSLGHMLGDELLKKVAIRLQHSTRGEDLIARMGGDEFAILMHNITDIDDAVSAAQRITQSFEQPFYIDGERIFTGASVGIAKVDSRYHQPQDILRDADLAMYRAKSAGRRCYTLFDESMYQQTLQTLKIESDLRTAIERCQFEVYYQPIINTHTHRIVSLEALVRWRHPLRGMIFPDEFIQLAEENGLIAEIDWQVMNRACHQLSEWRMLYPELADLNIAINLSAQQFMRGRLPEQVAALLEVTGLPAHCLHLEITERILLDDRRDVLETLQQLKNIGVTLLMDDFGTGYSSLSYLHRFPIDILKIDRSFISNMLVQTEHHAIVRTVVSLAKGLDMNVIAEGVEDQPTLAALAELDCDQIQGYLISKPQGAQQILAQLLACYRQGKDPVPQAQASAKSQQQVL